MTETLSHLIDRAAEIENRRKECIRRLGELKTAKDAIIERSKGPDDMQAISELTALASQETMLVHQLAKCEQELAGNGARLLNEATHVRRTLLKKLSSKRDKFLERMQSALLSAYPDPKQRRRALESLTAENPPTELLTLERAIAGIEGFWFQGNGASELAYATQLLGMIQRRVAQFTL